MFAANMLETSSGVVIVDDLSAEVLQELLHFVYTDELSSLTVLDGLAEELFCAASKYQVYGLIAVCEDSICNKINVDNVLNILSLSDVYGSSRIKDRAFQFITQNHTLIRKKDLVDIDKDLMTEIQFAMDMAMRRQGCLGPESEKRFGGTCVVM
jgi:hypothetical protein